MTKINLTGTLHGIGKGVPSFATGSTFAYSAQYERVLCQVASVEMVALEVNAISSQVAVYRQRPLLNRVVVVHGGH